LFHLFAAIALALAIAATTAQAAGPNAPGTCPNPSMADADGDGIPNGIDTDYVRPQDGTGSQYRRGAGPLGGQNGYAWQWREAFSGQNVRTMARACGFGPGTGTGVCDGTGPKGFGGFGKR
jgi:hypothetical protein